MVTVPPFSLSRLQRHGLAVLFALSTMCTSLVIMYNNMKTIKVQGSPAAATVRREGKTTAREDPPIPVLEGYISVSDHKPLKMHCKSCALVTSSGNLLGSKLGNKIDQTECVIRMNDAPTRGHGQDVGNKTSLRVIAHSSIQRVLRNRNELLNMSQGTVFIFWGPSSNMRRDGKGLAFNNLQLINKILPRLKVHTITRHKMLQLDELFKKETGKDRKISNTWLSTGWFTMSIALELCNTVNVYGMVPPDYCRSPNRTTVPYHYYEPMGPDECTMYISHERGRKGSHHRFITEKKVFANWAQTFNINFFQPDWKPETHTGNHLLVKPMF
ncbi:alpha-N-acetylgalactosaminide alpha-2,6-sialyltransferase 5 [Mantella aurantiaca]